jgi:histidyl-tRNA synthetase
MEKPSLPKGTRDFGPATMAKRQFILDSIRGVFQKFGFLPLETPAMENLTTLTGKYGEEGDQLLFKITESGDFYKPVKENLLSGSYNVARKLLPPLKNFFVDVFKDCLQLDELHLAKIKALIDNKSADWYLGVDISPAKIEALRSFVRDQFADRLFYLAYAYDGESYENEIDATLKLESYFTEESLLELLTSYLTRSGLSEASSKEVSKLINEKGLRYDLTVPFARYVVMNRHEIHLPFKRYQIQPVWRADRPQKGRYREFYQCDADVVGTDSLIGEAEIILMIKEVMQNLGIKDYAIKINHRSVLNGIAEMIGASDKANDLFVAIDKLDKVGEPNVRQELSSKGYTPEQLNNLFGLLTMAGTNPAKLDALTKSFSQSISGEKGVHDLTQVFELLNAYGSTDEHVEFDIALARGLSYYTGCIFEVKINHVSIGSVSGGGRYDNLTQAFGSKEQLSGVGISFGIDRLYDALEELNLFPKQTQISSTVLVCHFDEETRNYGLKVLAQLRQAGIASEIYPDLSKLKKQLDYANKKMIVFVLVVGQDEMKSGKLTCKHMESGEQERLNLEKIIQKLKP